MESKLPLRDYQSALADQVKCALDSASVVMQLPTGGGKTHIAADLAKTFRRLGKRVWFICHRREIVQQTSDALGSLGVSHGVVAAGHEFWGDWQVQVCSIDTLRAKHHFLIPPDVIIWDECHHVAAKSWSAIKESYPNAKHLGLTATPARLDGVGLGGFFDEMICGPTTRQLIDQGHLSTYRLFAPTIPDLRGINIKMGDYDKGLLSDRMSGSALTGDIVEHYKRIVPGRRAVAFAVSVKASQTIVERFIEAGIPAAHIDGRTPVTERQAAIGDLQAGRIKVLSNVEVFTEGFDLPAIDAVILLRPTKSFALFRQMIGRGLRVADGKSEAVILDHAGLLYEHGLPDDDVEWTLGGIVRKESIKIGNRLRRCPACSSVHVWAVECASCGHAYETNDRTIDEIYGDLQEFRRLPREGYESRAAFARRIGRAKSKIQKYADNGLPCDESGFVSVEAGIAWFADWTARIDASKGNGHRRIKEESKLKGQPFDAFAAAHGVQRKRAVLKKMGMPFFDDGTVNVEASVEWLKTARLPNGAIVAGYETRAEFVRRIGRWPRGNALAYLLDRGLPMLKNGLVHIDTGLDWARREGLVTASSSVAYPGICYKQADSSSMGVVQKS